MLIEMIGISNSNTNSSIGSSKSSISGSSNSNVKSNSHCSQDSDCYNVKVATSNVCNGDYWKTRTTTMSDSGVYDSTNRANFSVNYLLKSGDYLAKAYSTEVAMKSLSQQQQAPQQQLLQPEQQPHAASPTCETQDSETAGCCEAGDGSCTSTTADGDLGDSDGKENQCYNSYDRKEVYVI